MSGGAHHPHTHPPAADVRERLRAWVHHLEHVLPGQAPIKDFVHHNTLHGFQHLPFAQALTEARKLTGAAAYLPQERWRELYNAGRITRADLHATLRETPDLNADELLIDIGGLRLRRIDVLRVALLHTCKPLTRAQLKWQVEEMGALRRVQPEVDAAARARLLGARAGHEAQAVADLWAACLEVFDLAHAPLHPEELLDLSREQAEALAAHLHETGEPPAPNESAIARLVRKEAASILDVMFDRVGTQWTLRELLHKLTGEDLMAQLRPLMIRQVASHLDQGLAAWHNPLRARGFYAAWRKSAERDQSWVVDDVPEWRAQLERLPAEPLDAIVQELTLLGLPEAQWESYLTRLTLELPGWSGMFRWRGTRPGYAGEDVPVDMLDYVAVLLTMERLFAQRICRRYWQVEASLPVLRNYFRHHGAELLVRHALFESQLPEYLVSLALWQSQQAITTRDEAADAWQRLARLLWAWRQTPRADQRAGISVSGTVWPLFLLAQHLGLAGVEIRAVGRHGADELLRWLTRLDTDQAGYLWLCAYERHYRDQVFAALQANHGRGPWRERATVPAAQLVFCMDDREEGMRRHLEEIDPALETLGAAGFFGVAINWQGLDDTGVTPLCPVVVTPAHEVHELERADAQDVRDRHVRRRARRLRWKDWLVQGTRNGALAPVIPTVLAAPAALGVLIAKVFAPARIGRLTSRLRRAVDLTVPTQLAFQAPSDSPAATPAAPRLGFTDVEQADRVQAFLRIIGLTSGFAPLVVMMGHGSHSQNNPHLAAYDCGACSGRHGGPNARLFATMANRAPVRAQLAERGIHIPEGTWFVGAEHDTCDDAIEWYDEDRIPASLHDALATLKRDLAEAGRLHAQERCRRFASAPLGIDPARAWTHVANRADDFSQPRPELGHATNAAAFIGRRSMSRGAFFDRRAFLISYDPTQDPEGKVLETILLAVGPVGAGINLEYYFSTVNNDQYGCGTKAVHNVAGYFGVMEGAGSDLRTGLPRQMIEIHEAMRLLVVLEAKTEVITGVYERQASLRELIGNGWLLVAAKDPDGSTIHCFDPARGWIEWRGAKTELPKVTRSVEWFAHSQEPLPPALIERAVAQVRT